MRDWDHRLNPPPEGVWPVRVDDGRGSPTRDMLRGKGWRRTSRGFYVPADTPDTPSQRIMEAASRLPAYAALGGWAAAYWTGVRFLDGMRGLQPCPVPLNIGDGTGHIRPVPGALLLRTRLTEADVTLVRGIRVTTAVRTAFDGARLAATFTEAVVFLDMMFASGLLTPKDLATFLPEHRAVWKGTAQARAALALANPLSRSPQETRFRLLWVRASNLPDPLVNQPVFDLDGSFIAVPDLLDPDSATVGEYDGEQHRDLMHHAADNEREELLEDYGFAVVRVTSLDLKRPDLVVGRLNTARRRGLARDRRRDRWTLTPPGWYLARTA